MSLLIKKFRIKSFKEEKAEIELKNLSISYGNRQVIEDLNLKIQQSEISGLLGPNGSGKSSLYHCLIGLIKPTSGRVIINGEDATDIPTHIRCSKFGISWVPQHSGTFLDLTVYENLMAIAELHIKNKEERKSKVGNIIRKFELGNVVNIRSRFLSGGQQRRLSVGMAMVKNTKILVLDEPFSQLDPMAIKMIQQIIVSLQMLERITVSISDHSYRDLLNVCDSSMILSEGKIVAKGSKAELLRNEKAIANYFGKGL
tara:strand:- start:63 stop:833 length:771 start_codon:yes stop_codon:yes gene_type:complete